MNDPKIREMIELINKKGITKDEIVEVLRYYKQTKNPELFNAIVTANDWLVLHVLKKYKESPDYEDLLQEGRVGLITAIQKFDPDLGYAFSTYAYQYISGYATRFIEENRPVYMTFQERRDVRAYQKIKAANPLASDEEIAKIMNKTTDEINRYRICEKSLSVTSLDVPISDNDQLNTLIDFIPSESENADAAIMNENIKETINQMLQEVTANERFIYVVKSNFGLGCEPKTCRVLAEELGVSYQYVNQVVNKTVWSFRAPKIRDRFRRKLGIPQDVCDRDITNYLYQ